jgi:2-methylcitrate dehydratase PrpD
VTTATALFTISERLGRWIAATEVDDLPDMVVDDARWRLVDQVGVCIAGTREQSAAIVARVAGRFEGRQQATTIGFGQRLPAPTAGFVNGAVGHGPDFDDMNGVAAVHISSVAVPAALAAAELVGAGGAQCLLAMVLGAEVALRINTGAPPHQFHHRGLHGTGVAGPFAAAGIASRLLGLDGQRTTMALGMAGSRSSGLMQTLVDGSWVKRLHPGWAVEGGLMCALLAAEGYTGPAEVIEGRYGFYNALLHGDEETFDLDRIVDGLGERWMLPETTYKPWPNGVWNHASMDGAAEIVRREHLSVDEIERIDTYLPERAVPIIVEPREAKIHPTSAYHMKFGVQYAVAMLLVRGTVEVDDFTDEVLADRRIAELAARVYGHVDTSMAPDRFPARVEITTRDGRAFVEDVPAQRGNSANPFSPNDHRRKFRGNVEATLGAERTAALLAQLEDGWKAADISALMRMTVAEPAS